MGIRRLGMDGFGGGERRWWGRVGSREMKARRARRSLGLRVVVG